MKRITKFMIEEITLEGLRSYQEKTSFRLGAYTQISGKNRAGKTSLCHAVSYALFGVTALGDQNIGRIMNDQGEKVEVTLQIVDQDGVRHEICRRRVRGTVTVLYNGTKARQEDIASLFGDKETFLSLFCPGYFITSMRENSREFLLKNLPAVENSEVFRQLSDVDRGCLENETFASPEVFIKDLRERNRALEKEIVFLDGKLEHLREELSSQTKDLSVLRIELEEKQKQYQTYTDRQFDSIEQDELLAERTLLEESLEKSGYSQTEQDFAEVREQIAAEKEHRFLSPYTARLSSLRSEILALRDRLTEVSSQLRQYSIGGTCPCCGSVITESMLAFMQKDLLHQIEQIKETGHRKKQQFEQLRQQEASEKEKFERDREERLSHLTAKYMEIQKMRHQHSGYDAITRISQIDELLRMGSLTESEYTEMCALSAEIKELDARIRAKQENDPASAIEEQKHKRSGYEAEIQKNRNMIFALGEFTAKRSELAFSRLKMPNIRIQLYELIRSTGELKNVFRLLWRGREYQTLSTSEQILAGVETCWMLRRILDLDYPVYIDNTESIQGIHPGFLPSQVIFLRHIPGQELTVRTSGASFPQEMKKAG